MDKKGQIDKEYRRLLKIYKSIDEDKKNVVIGLIQRAAYMRVTLEEFEKNLNENGFTELFSQGDQKPYDRKRPVADLYNTMNTAYQKAIKQLTDLLPKPEKNNRTKDDGFDGFVNGREDV